MEKIQAGGKQVVIYGFGIAGRWACDRFEAVVGIVDTDHKKWGKIYNGIEVFSPKFLEKIDLEKTLILVTAVDIFDIVPKLKRLKIPHWKSLAEFLDNSDDIYNATGENDSFLKYSLETVKNCHSAFIKGDKLVLRSVDVVITEKCTLKCKDCANLMQFFENPRNFDPSDVITGIKLLSIRCDDINEVRLIGGEPFLNKKIYQILGELIEIKNIHSIVIYTNGMIPPKVDHAELLRNKKIHFSVTDYGDLGRNTSKTIEFLEDKNISYRAHPPENWTDSGRIEWFERSDHELKELFSNCCGKNLFTLIEDRLYRCPFAANADSLGAVPENRANYVNVGSSAEKIRQYSTEIEFLPACSFCPGRSFDSPEIEPAIQAENRKPLPYKKYKTVSPVTSEA